MNDPSKLGASAPYRAGPPWCRVCTEWESHLLRGRSESFRSGMVASAILVSSLFLVAALLGWCVAGTPLLPAAPAPASVAPAPAFVEGVSVDVDPEDLVVRVKARCPPRPAPAACADDPQARIRELWTLAAGGVGDGGGP